MSDDWAKKYVESYNQEQQGKQQKEQEDRERRRLAEDGAREKFHQIVKRMREDVQTLQGAVGFRSLEVKESPEGKFTVMHASSPYVELNITLRVTTIMCEYVFSPRKAGPAKHEPKTLRICSDLDGHIAVAANGGEETFAYDSEVSHFLLRPVLNYIVSP